MNNSVIKVNHISKAFRVGNQEVMVLKGVSFSIERDDFMIIFGPSGCGKSTLLHTILGLEEPSQGTVNFLDTDVYNRTTEDDRAQLRKHHFGMVYQQPNWIKSLTVGENIAFPLLLMGKPRVASLAVARQILDLMEMTDWERYIPTELSSGQQQKVSLARALVTNPEVIIADEPTGNLDFESGQELMKLLKKLNQEQNKTILMVTHDLEYLEYASSVIRMFNGTVVGQYNEKNKSKLRKEVQGQQAGGIRLKKKNGKKTKSN